MAHADKDEQRKQRYLTPKAAPVCDVMGDHQHHAGA
jgi:hypothetical protein